MTGNVLVIDDDPGIHALVKVALTKAGGLEGFSALTGEEGLQRLENHYFDMIILDLGLPGKDGLQVLRAIRGSIQARNVPVLILTGKRDRDTLIKCVKLGISDYVVKPFQLAAFIPKLVMIWRNIQLERQRPDPGAALVQLHRTPGVAEIIYAGVFNRSSLEQTQRLYTPQFDTQTRLDRLVLNFSGLPEFTAEQLVLAQLLLRVFGARPVCIIGGRNYGPLVPIIDDVENQLFIIEQDFLDYLELKKK